MGFLSEFFSKPQKAFFPGLVFYDREEDLYVLYKVIRAEGSTLYVRAYWPSPKKPTEENLGHFELRTSCEAVEINNFVHPLAVLKEHVSPSDEEGYHTFIRIQEGIHQRAEQHRILLEKADELLKKGAYGAAEAVYTECAPFSRYHFPVFANRGYCLLQLERYGEAVADLEHALSIFDGDPSTLYYCARANHCFGKNDRALELLDKLFTFDAAHPDGHALRFAITGEEENSR